MKNILKFIQTGLIVLLLAITANAQTSTISNNKTNTISLGYIPTMGLDAPTFGLHLGYNKVFSTTRRFVPEFQASYSFATFEGNAGFFAHGDGNLQIVNILGGSRFYILKREQKANLYLNLLAGYAVVFDKKIKQEGTIKDTEHGLGLSTGLFLETKNNITLGISVETYATAVVKIGYNF